MKQRLAADRWGWKMVGLVFALAGLAAASQAQNDPSSIQGKALANHPAGQAVLAAGRLLAAGKLAQVKNASTAEQKDEWASMTAAEQREEAENAKNRAPDPDRLNAEMTARGELTIYGDFASLEIPSADGNSTIMAFVGLEGGTWRVTAGPIVVDTSPVVESAPSLRGVEILEHEIGQVFLAYAQLVAGGNLDQAMEWATREARQARLQFDAKERGESDRYRMSTLPSPQDLEAQVRDGGIVLFEAEGATLNVITQTQTENADGSVSYSSTTVAVPFTLENGSWRIAR
jgi:hypothetical protein